MGYFFQEKGAYNELVGQTGQCDPSKLFPYNKNEENLLQLQFHHTGTAF